jgi:hypothetical protein
MFEFDLLSFSFGLAFGFLLFWILTLLFQFFNIIGDVEDA